MLTISQLARHAGTTVRAVRLYHQRGLLAEPARAANGYRVYRARHLVRLLQIRRLRDVGIPLRDLPAMLDEPPQHQRATLEALDRELADQARRIRRQRAVLRTAMARTDDLRLPPEVAEIIDRLRSAGSPERTLEESAAAFVLLLALASDAHAEQMKAWFLEQVRRGPETFVRQSLEYEELYDLDPHDPAVEAYVERTFAETQRMTREEVAAGGQASDETSGLVEEHQRLLDDVWAEVISPAQQRADDLLRRKIAEWVSSMHRTGPGPTHDPDRAE